MQPSLTEDCHAFKSFKAEICDKVTIPADAGLWSGGTRETFHVVRIADGAAIAPVNHSAAPWDGRSEREIVLEPGILVIRHSMFCGKDHGLTFYVRGADIAPLLPNANRAFDDMSANARSVLGVIRSLISSYRAEEYQRMRLTAEQVTTAKAELTARGYIDKRGAITTAGRNALNRVSVS